MRWNRLKNYVLPIASWLSIFTCSSFPAWGQIDATGATAITTDGTQLQITGGVQSSDGKNLFHQFASFNVHQDETVTFIPPNSVENILGRVSGGEASIIDGRLAVSNSAANLWLLNPAGILFGTHAQLNLQGDFSATTADAIGFAQGWFTAEATEADYQALVGNPQSFAFVSNPGHLINLGNLQVAPSQNLRLLGGSVINVGTLTAPAGTITIAAVPNSNRVNLGQVGQLLTLEIEPWDNTIAPTDITPISLPALLTGSSSNHANTLTIAADGTGQLTQLGVSLVPAIGQVVVSGEVNTGGLNTGSINTGSINTGSINTESISHIVDQGGQIVILGETISLADATIRADGIHQGGHIYIGGDYQGAGILPNATETRVNHSTQLTANALEQGEGGRVIIWADETTQFSGNVQAQGGRLGGNGGFIEISGKSHLEFDGQFSLNAPQGEAGTILFDPDNIRIISGGTPSEIATESALLPEVDALDKDNGWLTLHEATLESWEGDSDIIFQANDHIVIDLGGNNELKFRPGSGSITFKADVDTDGIGNFEIAQTGDVINSSGRDITISGEAIVIQSLDTRSDDPGNIGNITLSAPTQISIEETLVAKAIVLSSDDLHFNGGNNSITGQTLTIAPDDPSLDIHLGPNTDHAAALNIKENEILAINNDFTAITIGRADSTGTITLYNAIADGGTSPLQDPVNIAGANILKGPEQPTLWTITETGQGNLNGIFSNGLSFENIDSVVASNGASHGLQGSAGNDTIVFSSIDAGTFNGINFARIQNFDGAGGDDRFVFGNGARISGELDGGAGNNTLDYSTYITDILIDLETNNVFGIGDFSNIQTIIAGGGSNTIQGTSNSDIVTLTGVGTGIINGIDFQSFETIVTGDGNDLIVVTGGILTSLDGGLGIDTLQATDGNDTIEITDTNTGTLNGQFFSNIENINTRAGNDIISFNDGKSITGTLMGGDGTDTIDYSNYITNLTIDLQTQQATGIDGGFDTIELIIGGRGDDTFQLANINPIQDIDGGDGNNTLLGSNTSSIWNLTNRNIGYRANGSGDITFDNIQNLTAGNQSDQVNFLASGAQFNGELDGGEGVLTLSGDSLGIGTDLKGNGALILQPASPDRDMRLGGPGLTVDLDISTSELSKIHSGFTDITIGHPDGSNHIRLSDNLSFSVPITIRSPQGDGAINSGGYTLEASQITLLAAQDIETSTLTAPNGVSLQSNSGNITTHTILTRNTANGGNINLNAGGTITTEQIDTTSTSGSGGHVTLNAPSTIQVESIRAEGNSAGGTIDITTEAFFQTTGNFTNLNGNTASISTVANSGTGSITIRHAGNGVTPFEIGNGSVLGTDSTITSGIFQLTPNSTYFNSYTLGNIALITRDLLQVSSSPAIPSTSTLDSTSPVRSNPGAPAVGANLITIQEAKAPLGAEDHSSTLFERLETSFSNQFKSHLNLYERVSVSPISLEAAQKTLGDVERVLAVKPGVVYVYFLPPENKDTALPDPNGLNPDDELGLLLVTHNGQRIHRKIEGVTRADVMAVAEDFSAQVTNSMSTASQYLPPAQQLYTWFITPIENELQEQQIQSLAMVMDTGLRTLPVAALHNGDEFLIERYSLGVIPSFSLTNFNPENFLYTQLDDTQLLAMGASQFPSQQQLPAVPDELEMITNTFPNSEVFLNDDFTLSNLKNKVSQHDFGIVHLASHGVFESGNPRNSYIQLWDQHLQLDQVHTLGLQKANIALMVLSACNTALGDREAEYGFAGLAVNTGVQTSVASLWPISDEGTLGLMTYFYEHLQQQPVRAFALRQAQLAMVQGDLQFVDGILYGADERVLAEFPELKYHGRWNFEHPFYWSTYTLVGSPW